MGEAIYPVPAQWAETALVGDARYQDMYRRSVEDPEGFWRDEAKRVDWIKPFTKVKETSFHEADFGIKWFADGTLNLSANALIATWPPAAIRSRSSGNRTSRPTRAARSPMPSCTPMSAALPTC